MHTYDFPVTTRQYRIFIRWGQKVVYDLFLNLQERLEAMGAKEFSTLDNEGDFGIAFDYEGSRFVLKSGLSVTAAKGSKIGENATEARALKFLLQLERGALPKLQVEIAQYDIDFAGTRDQAISLHTAAEDLAEKIHGFVSGKLV